MRSLLFIQRIVGILLGLCSMTMLPPAAIGYLYRDGSTTAFLESFIALLVIGLVLFLPVRKHHREMRTRDGFLIVVICWTVLGVFGALPLLLSPTPQMNVVDAIFESMSALTTTGATVLTGIDELPKGILFYRQQMQWLGGMGIVVLAVAILPMLRIGGMQLYRAETPGPMKDSKLTPRITETAKALWYIYLGLTVMCAAAYYLAGMDVFDAVSHSFTTIAIGGFSTHDLSIGYFNSPLIEGVAVVFMTLAGMNFALHFLAWRKGSTSPYLYDTELRVYLSVLLGLAIVSASLLYFTNTYASAAESIRHGVFQAVSAGTTTGFTTASFYLWPGLLPLALVLSSFVGGCAGSTGGGMKVIRMLLLYKQGYREIMRLVHPNAQIAVKVGGKVLSSRVIDSVWGFFSLYIASFCVMSLVLAGTGLDLVTAVSSVAACMNNLGPALASAGPHYADLPATAKAVLTFAMLLGRLEVFTLLVLFMPAFWRK